MSTRPCASLPSPLAVGNHNMPYYRKICPGGDGGESAHRANCQHVAPHRGDAPSAEYGYVETSYKRWTPSGSLFALSMCLPRAATTVGLRAGLIVSSTSCRDHVAGIFFSLSLRVTPVPGAFGTKRSLQVSAGTSHTPLMISLERMSIPPRHLTAPHCETFVDGFPMSTSRSV